MTNYERIKDLTIEELANWLEAQTEWDDSSAAKWWDENYCSKCPMESVRKTGSDTELEVFWCDLHSRCKYFPDMENTPSAKQILEFWLQAQTEG